MCVSTHTPLFFKSHLFFNPTLPFLLRLKNKTLPSPFLSTTPHAGLCSAQELPSQGIHHTTHHTPHHIAHPYQRTPPPMVGYGAPLLVLIWLLAPAHCGSPVLYWNPNGDTALWADMICTAGDGSSVTPTWRTSNTTCEAAGHNAVAGKEQCEMLAALALGAQPLQATIPTTGAETQPFGCWVASLTTEGDALLCTETEAALACTVHGDIGAVCNDGRCLCSAGYRRVGAAEVCMREGVSPEERELSLRVGCADVGELAGVQQDAAARGIKVLAWVNCSEVDTADMDKLAAAGMVLTYPCEGVGSIEAVRRHGEGELCVALRCQDGFDLHDAVCTPRDTFELWEYAVIFACAAAVALCIACSICGSRCKQCCVGGCRADTSPKPVTVDTEVGYISYEVMMAGVEMQPVRAANDKLECAS